MEPVKPPRERGGPSILGRKGMMAGLILIVAVIALVAILILMTPPEVSPVPTPAATTATATSASPIAELFVMSFCPFGTQAETAMAPVVSLLGSKAQILVVYIADVQGNSVSSLHGAAEAQEDLRQLCISKYYPSQLWPYLTSFIRDCYPKVSNAASLATCQANTMEELGIDAAQIGSCTTGSESLALLKADEKATTRYGVTASPTLIINGQTFDGDRTPEAYKEAICSHFDTPPAECSTNLSSQAPTSTGGCG